MSDHWRISAGEKLIEELRIHDSDMANEAADEITSLRQRLSSAEAELECLRHAAPVVDVAVVVDAERDALRRKLATADEATIHLVDAAVEMRRQRDGARAAARWLYKYFGWAVKRSEAKHRWPWLSAADTPCTTLPKPGETAP